MSYFAVFGSIRLGIEPDSTVLIADSLSMHALNGKTLQEKKSRNVDSVDSTTKHQYFFGVYCFEIVGFWPSHEQNRLLYKSNF